MLLPASRDAKRIIYGLITLQEEREEEEEEKNGHLLLRLLSLSLFSFFLQPQRGTLKEITIMNKCAMVIEVEQPLKESPGRYNQGL